MIKAVKDFDHLGTKVKAGDVLPPNTFVPKDMAGLFAKGLLKETEAKPAEDKQKDLEPEKESKRSKKK